MDFAKLRCPNASPVFWDLSFLPQEDNTSVPSNDVPPAQYYAPLPIMKALLFPCLNIMFLKSRFKAKFLLLDFSCVNWTSLTVVLTVRSLVYLARHIGLFPGPIPISQGRNW